MLIMLNFMKMMDFHEIRSFSLISGLFWPSLSSWPAVHRPTCVVHLYSQMTLIWVLSTVSKLVNLNENEVIFMKMMTFSWKTWHFHEIRSFSLISGLFWPSLSSWPAVHRPTCVVHLYSQMTLIWVLSTVSKLVNLNENDVIFMTFSWISLNFNEFQCNSMNFKHGQVHIWSLWSWLGQQTIVHHQVNKPVNCDCPLSSNTVPYT